MLRSLLFLLVVVCSIFLGDIDGDAMHYDLESDVKMSWHRETAGKSREEVIQKLSK